MIERGLVTDNFRIPKKIKICHLRPFQGKSSAECQ